MTRLIKTCLLTTRCIQPILRLWYQHCRTFLQSAAKFKPAEAWCKTQTLPSCPKPHPITIRSFLMINGRSKKYLANETSLNRIQRHCQVIKSLRKHFVFCHLGNFSFGHFSLHQEFWTFERHFFETVSSLPQLKSTNSEVNNFDSVRKKRRPSWSFLNCRSHLISCFLPQVIKVRWSWALQKHLPRTCYFWIHISSSSILIS